MHHVSDGTLNEFLDRLRSVRRGAFLGNLCAEVAQAARGAYTEAGRSPEEAARLLRCSNELILVIAKQIWSDTGETDIGYPDNALFDVLTEKATMGGCRAELDMALERALHRTLSQAESGQTPQ